MKKNLLKNFLYSLVSVVFTAFLCARLNRFAMENYYGSLSKPFLTPPDFVFPLVWTVLYALLIMALDFILNLKNGKNSYAVKLFAAGLVLQVVWSYVFFYKGLFLVGFAVIVIMCFLAAVTTKEFYYLHKIAGLLMVPYVIWLLFAAYLNWGMADLNGSAVL